MREKSILVIDDDTELCELLIDYLQALPAAENIP